MDLQTTGICVLLKRMRGINMLLVQKIKVSWNKESRGGEGAIQRSKMKQAAMLPKNFFEYVSFGQPYHFLYLSQDKQGFHTTTEGKYILKEKKDPMRFLCDPIEIVQENNDKYRVNYRYDLHYGAIPPRYQYNSTGTLTPLNEEAFTLHMGEYGQAICNGRFVDIDLGWWGYEMEIVNIRIMPKDSAHLDCFLSEEPTYIYKQMAFLR